MPKEATLLNFTNGKLKVKYFTPFNNDKDFSNPISEDYSKGLLAFI